MDFYQTIRTYEEIKMTNKKDEGRAFRMNKDITGLLNDYIELQAENERITKQFLSVREILNNDIRIFRKKTAT